MKHFKIVFTLLLVAMCYLNQAQGGFRLRVNVPGATSHTGKDVFELQNGNYFGIGSYMDVENNAYRRLLVMVGFNAQGQLLWMKKYGSTAIQYYNPPYTTRTACYVNNHLYHCGSILPFGSLVTGIKGFLMKLNTNGDTLWQKKYSHLIMNVILQKVSPSVDGGFLLVGQLHHKDSASTPGLLIKTDINGNELWRKQFNKTDPNFSQGKVLLQDSVSKNIVISGNQFNSNSLFYDMVVVLDSLGNQLSRDYSIWGGAQDLVQTRDKKFVAVGRSNISNDSSQYQSFAYKFNATNPTNKLWRINGFGTVQPLNNFNSIVELNNGNLLMAGSIDTLQKVNFRYNGLIRLAWFNTNGQLLKLRDYDYAPNKIDDNLMIPIVMNKTADGGCIVSVRNDYVGRNPLFFIKYDSLGCDSTEYYCKTVGLNEQKGNRFNISLLPNPVQDILTIEAENEVFPMDLNIVDISGRQVKNFVIEHNTQVPLHTLPRGFYFVEFRQQTKLLYSQKLIKE